MGASKAPPRRHPPLADMRSTDNAVQPEKGRPHTTGDPGIRRKRPQSQHSAPQARRRSSIPPVYVEQPLQSIAPEIKRRRRPRAMRVRARQRPFTQAPDTSADGERRTHVAEDPAQGPPRRRRQPYSAGYLPTNRSTRPDSSSRRSGASQWPSEPLVQADEDESQPPSPRTPELPPRVGKPQWSPFSPSLAGDTLGIQLPPALTPRKRTTRRMRTHPSQARCTTLPALRQVTAAVLGPDPRYLRGSITQRDGRTHASTTSGTRVVPPGFSRPQPPPSRWTAEEMTLSRNHGRSDARFIPSRVLRWNPHQPQPTPVPPPIVYPSRPARSVPFRPELGGNSLHT